VLETGGADVVTVGVRRIVGVRVGEVRVEMAYLVRGPSPVSSSEQPAVMMHPKIDRIQMA
jgi:hypothetical protein